MVNKVILIGNVGQDPEVRHSQSGGKIASFSLATSESWKDRNTGEKKTQTQWHRIVIFNENIANVVEQYVKKGHSIYIEGTLQNRKYTAQDGVERNISEIIISQFKGELQFVGNKNSGAGGEESSSYSNNKGESSFKAKENKSPVDNFSEDLDDEIPF